MAWSDYFNGTTGLTYYAKPIPVVESPWATDVVASGAEGFSGEYPFSGLADGVDYAIFIQAGGSPASSDVKDGYLYFRISSDVVTNLTAVKKLLEADEVINLEGGVYKRHLYERGTTTDLVSPKTVKLPSGGNLTDPDREQFGGYQE